MEEKTIYLIVGLLCFAIIFFLFTIALSAFILISVSKLSTTTSTSTSITITTTSLPLPTTTLTTYTPTTSSTTTSIISCENREGCFCEGNKIIECRNGKKRIIKDCSTFLKRRCGWDREKEKYTCSPLIEVQGECQKHGDRCDCYQIL